MTTTTIIERGKELCKLKKEWPPQRVHDKILFCLGHLNRGQGVTLARLVKYLASQYGVDMSHLIAIFKVVLGRMLRSKLISCEDGVLKKASVEEPIAKAFSCENDNKIAATSRKMPLKPKEKRKDTAKVLPKKNCLPKALGDRKVISKSGSPKQKVKTKKAVVISKRVTTTKKKSTSIKSEKNRSKVKKAALLRAKKAKCIEKGKISKRK